ncbi:MAG: glycosyl hydrolase family 43, partial [Lentisphaeria bacterium]|nr:glycosyl hydrolase family 43 [Lentisphaeria bacterium]
IADDPEGPYRRFDTPAWEEDFSIEDPFVWHDGNEFNMIAKDITGKQTGELISAAYLKSSDGHHWRSMGQAYSRTITYDDGETVTLGALERPQLLFDASGKPKMLFAAAGDGTGGFRKAHNTWNCAVTLISK